VKVTYKKLFVKDLFRLKGTETYDRVKELAFEILPNCGSLSEIQGIKPLKNAKNAFRIRAGEYRIGLKKEGDAVEVRRVLHRKDIYRFFP
jgi:mRNA interferase RelE/StbE